MIQRLSAAALDLLRSPAEAIVATINANGTPHMSVAWIALEGDEIVLGTLNDQRKLRNLRRDPRITLTVLGGRINEWGLREYLIIEGRASVTEGGAAELLQRLALTYIGPDAVFPGMPDPPPGFITRVHIQRIGGVGPWQAP